MEKRNRLRFRTPDNTITSIDTSFVLPPKLETEENIHKDNKQVMHEEESSTIFQRNNSSISEFHNYSYDFEDDTCSKPQTRLRSAYNLLKSYKRHLSCLVLCLGVLYFLFRPTEYSFLIDEITKLKEENELLKNLKIETNLCDILQGTSVTSHSELYGYGFLGKITTDPNSILEPGDSRLALRSSKGFVEISFKKPCKIKKISLYHPVTANQKSAIKEFVLCIKDKTHEFEFNCGYQEYQIEENVSDKVLIQIKSNHGDDRYTSIYRISIFG